MPEINPFFEPYRLQRPLAPNEVDTIRPVTSYIPETKIAFIEDFEDNRPRIFTDQLVGSAELERTAMEVFEGAYSGVLTLDPDNALVEIASGTAYTDLLTGGVYVYLEVNYKSEAPVAWGIAANVDPAIGFESFVDPGFFPSEEWNKIYFSLSPIIYGANLTGEPHKVTLQAFLGEGSPDTARVYLDNIKLLHF